MNAQWSGGLHACTAVGLHHKKIHHTWKRARRAETVILACDPPTERPGDPQQRVSRFTAAVIEKVRKSENEVALQSKESRLVIKLACTWLRFASKTMQGYSALVRSVKGS